MVSVFEEARSAVAAQERCVDRLEPGTLDVSGAKKLVDLFTRCERLSVAGRGLAARRVMPTGYARERWVRVDGHARELWVRSGGHTRPVSRRPHRRPS